jgi:hypothetical protein
MGCLEGCMKNDIIDAKVNSPLYQLAIPKYLPMPLEGMHFRIR